jgi:hypothetical protein
VPGGYITYCSRVVTFQLFRKREYGYYVLPILVGDRLVGRVEPRFDRKTRTLEVLGAWGDTSRLDEALTSLAAFLGADRIDSTAL